VRVGDAKPLELPGQSHPVRRQSSFRTTTVGGLAQLSQLFVLPCLPFRFHIMQSKQPTAGVHNRQQGHDGLDVASQRVGPQGGVDGVEAVQLDLAEDGGTRSLSKSDGEAL